MYKGIRIVRKLLFIITAIICLSITASNISNIVFTSDGTMFIINKYTDTYYEPISDNVGLTNINGISNVYINMQAEGYNIHKEVIKDNTIDVSFIKEGFPSYRYYYQHSDGRITFFCSEYESSHKGVSYIIDERAIGVVTE